MRIREGCILTATNSSDERVKSLIGCKGALHVVNGEPLRFVVLTKRPCAMTSVPYTLWQAQSCVSAPPMRISPIFVRFLSSALLSAKSA